MTFLRPDPPVYPDVDDVEDDLLAADMLREYDEALYEYNFRYVWLPQALGESEYATVRHLQVSLLVDMYPYVHQFGPNGITWVTYCKKLLHALQTSKRGEPVNVSLLRKFLDTYENYRFFATAQSDGGGKFWSDLYQQSVEMQRGDWFLGEVDRINDPLMIALVEHRNWSFFSTTSSTEVTALSHFATLVLQEDILRGLPQFAQQYEAHDAFLADVAW